MKRTQCVAFCAATLALSGSVGGTDRTLDLVSSPPTGGACAALIAESTASIREAMAIRPRELYEPWNRLFDPVVDDRFRPERLCAEGSGGAWAIVFGAPRRTVSNKPRPGTETLFFPWKLVHVDKGGRRLEMVGLNPFVNSVPLPVKTQQGAATLESEILLIPELVVGDFDGTGGEQAIVMTVWPEVVDPEREPDPEYGDMSFYWPREPTLGVAYIVREGRIETRRGLAGSWLTSVRRRDASSEWDMKSYGPFFQFMPAHEFDISDSAYPVFGPEFTVFRGGLDGLTLDDPRQVPLLRVQCQEALRSCGEILPVEHVAILDAVCERVAGAPLLRANKNCAHSIKGARRTRFQPWIDGWRRTPVPGVRQPSKKR